MAAPAMMMPQAAPVAAPAPPLFALLIPGRTLDTNFVQVDAKKLMITVAAPALITEVTICMLQPSIPADHGVAVYYALPPFADWQYLGAITLAYPTAAFRAVWRDKIPADLPCIGIGLSVESLPTLAALQPTTADTKESEATLDSAKGIAKNLYEYMASYSQNTGQYKQLGDVLVIPTNCVDKCLTTAGRVRIAAGALRCDCCDRESASHCVSSVAIVCAVRFDQGSRSFSISTSSSHISGSKRIRENNTRSHETDTRCLQPACSCSVELPHARSASHSLRSLALFIVHPSILEVQIKKVIASQCFETLSR